MGWIDALKQLAAIAAPVPVIIGLVEVIKKAVDLPSRWAPVVALALGACAGALGYAASVFPEVENALPYILGGLVAGLVACGAYSGVKATVFGK